MRKVTLSLIAAAVAATATPAMANNAENFEGAKAEIMAGFDLTNLPGSLDNLTGPNVAVAAGYDIAAGNVILGVEAEAGLHIATTSFPVPPNQIKGNRDLYAGVRAGVPVSEKTMVYAKGGYANKRLRITNGAGTTLSAPKLDGIRGGAGVEHKISDSMHIKGEYRYTNYESSVESHQAMIGVGIRF